MKPNAASRNASAGPPPPGNGPARPSLFALRPLPVGLLSDFGLRLLRFPAGFGIAGLAWLLGALPLAAQSTNGPTRLDYSSFRLIAERNIFNAYRSGRSSRSREDDQRPPARVDAFTLVGTMEYEKGLFAFFDSTSSEYRKTLQAGGAIGGYQLAEIGSGRVKLTNETAQHELRMGMQLRRQEGGEWEVRASGEAYASYSPRSERAGERGGERGSDRWGGRGSDRRGDRGGGNRTGAEADSSRSTNGAAAGATASTSSADADEVLKRLMQQREKETQ